MAKGNLVQGQGSGKVGDLVFMVRNGQQVSRVYTTSGSRSGKEASEASRIQRVKFGSASNQWGLYRYVCTRMYRSGRTSKQSDYNYFVKRNNTLFPYLTKEENAMGVHVLQPGVFSEGKLGTIELVLEYIPSYSEGSVSIALHDSIVSPITPMYWKGVVSDLKAQLRLAYPNARKVTYLLSFVTEITLEEGSNQFASQYVKHFPVILDLYNEVSSGEDALSVVDFFKNKISDTSLSAIINHQEGSILSGNSIFRLIPSSAEENQTLSRLSILFFATDDIASEAYTTTLPEDGVNPTAGAYADWSGYRTSNALRVAADSYGYQNGVMRDDIASAGNNMSLQVQVYAARLARVNSKASADFLKSVGDVSQAQAKVVRKSAEEK